MLGALINADGTRCVQYGCTQHGRRINLTRHRSVRFVDYQPWSFECIQQFMLTHHKISIVAMYLFSLIRFFEQTQSKSRWFIKSAKSRDTRTVAFRKWSTSYVCMTAIAIWWPNTTRKWGTFNTDKALITMHVYSSSKSTFVV